MLTGLRLDQATVNVRSVLIHIITRSRFIFFLLLIAGTTLLGQTTDIKSALTRAGENRAELELFIESAKNTHGDFGLRAANFLVSNMPEKDRIQLSS